MAAYQEYRRVAHNMIDHDVEDMSDEEKGNYFRNIVHLLAFQYPDPGEAINMLENEIENGTAQSQNVDPPTVGESADHVGYW